MDSVGLTTPEIGLDASLSGQQRIARKVSPEWNPNQWYQNTRDREVVVGFTTFDGVNYRAGGRFELRDEAGVSKGSLNYRVTPNASFSHAAEANIPSGWSWRFVPNGISQSYYGSYEIY
jgi:hypothetical protein